MSSHLIINPLNGAWWLVFMLMCGGSVLLWALRRGKPDQRRFMIRFCVFMLVYLVAYRISLYLNPLYDFNIWNELPLYPCNVIAVIALPATIMGGSDFARWLRGYCFYGGVIFAPVAMLMPMEHFYDIPLLSINAAGYYGFHGLLLVLAVSFASLGLYKPCYRDVPGVLVIFSGLGVTAHIVNVILRATVYPEANYFFTYGMDGNFIMDFLKSVIPINLVCVMPLVAVMGALCILITSVVNLSGRAIFRRRTP